MDVLFDLIQSLHPFAIKTIKNSFNKPRTRTSDSFLLEKLFDLLVIDNNTDNELSLILYGSSNITALSKLKSRLFHLVLDILSSDAILLREELFDPFDKKSLRIRKKMFHFRILHRSTTHPPISVLFHLLDEIIKEAKKYELFDVLVDALYFKRRLYTIRKDFAEVKSICEQIKLYEYSFNAVQIVADYYYDLSANYSTTELYNEENYKIKLRAIIQDTANILKQTNASYVKYYYKIFELEELQINKQIPSCLIVCKEMIKIVEEHKHLFRKDRLGFVFDNISVFQVHNKDFKQAVISSKEAQKHYAKENFNMLISLKHEFLALFYGGYFKDAVSVMKKMYEFPKENSGNFRNNKILFFEASLLFQIGNYKEALDICNNPMKISEDKYRWGLGVRYLRLLCMIELKMLDQASAYIEALRKIIGEDKNNSIRSRDKLIYLALKEFSNLHFSLNCSEKLASTLIQLSNKNDANSWAYFTHELIPIHEYIQSKIGRTKKL